MKTATTATRPVVYGVALDAETRCAHYHSALDVIAIKMACCRRYYACRECHDERADHACDVWPKAQWDQPAILCGVCDAEISVSDYLAGDSRCRTCGAPWNPGCRTHRHLYFEAP